MHEAGDKIGELAAAVEAVGGHPQVARHVLGIGRVVGAVDGPLDITWQCVDPPQAGLLATGRAPAGDSRDVLAAGLGDTPEAGQAVGLHPGARLEVACGPPSQDGLAEALDAAHAQLVGPTVRGDFDRTDERRLTGRATDALTTALPAPIGVVRLHDARQRDALVALTQRLHQLVLRLPGGVLADTELARQLKLSAAT